ncbi:hypothetical protein [Deinococcus murrayi]|uniref:hypothetical protein n=1 Tax=Deinococcus murrayi TaxID=68910 RepID=UPI00048044A8|nr:hypothetical protein [Deinococcus murrayi]
MSRPAEAPLARLRRVMVPGTTGGVYTLLPGALGFFVVLALYVHSYATGRPMPGVTGELLTASVGMLGVHTLRGISADRANAANGVTPVPADPTDPALAAEGLPDLRPRER